MKQAIFSGILALLLTALTASGQEQPRNHKSDDVFQARLIKIKRMSEDWKNQPVELRLYGGSSQSGRFVTIHDRSFHLMNRGQASEVPVSAVQSVVLKRKPQDLGFVALTSVAMAALFAGSVSLGFEDASASVPAAAGIGAAIGFAIGWKAFFQNEVIKLE